MLCLPETTNNSWPLKKRNWSLRSRVASNTTSTEKTGFSTKSEAEKEGSFQSGQMRSQRRARIIVKTATSRSKAMTWRILSSRRRESWKEGSVWETRLDIEATSSLRWPTSSREVYSPSASFVEKRTITASAPSASTVTKKSASVPPNKTFLSTCPKNSLNRHT